MDATDRLDCRQYNLSALQLAHLLDGDIGDRNPKNLEKEIQDTAIQLDKRLQYLIEDICILYEQGYLNKENWPVGWDQLSDLNRNDNLYDPPLGIVGASQETMDYMSMAMHLGHVCRLLYSATAPQFDSEMAALGFLIGLRGGWLSEDWRAESSQKLLKVLPEEGLKADIFEMPSSDTSKGLADVLRQVDDSFTKEDIVQDEDIELRNRLEESNLTLTPTVFEYAEEMLVTADFPATSPVIEGVVDQTTANHELKKAERLADQLIQDIDSLVHHNYRGGEAIQVFWAIHTTESVEDNDDIVGSVDTKKHQVSKLMTDLCGRESPWDLRPVIVDGQFGIKKTNYGKLIAQLLTAESDDKKYAVPPDNEIYDACHAAILGESDDVRQELMNEVLSEVEIDT
ncbi:hypothetical protein SAMN06264855_10666 [Halorubrum vacuolatum]|uniref:Uncharacterized protein n=2 Tax=Halorubrum vacuolatum TaxID=63740 RepID=A0A238W972_HALVU|nr:hypothetical protein SAMN06264855_10666 [Halorubrum vacuolatum]